MHGDTRLWHPFTDMSYTRHHEVVLTRGEDVWVWDDQGRRYLDATASLWYANAGHGRPEIAAAIARQLAELDAYAIFGDFANPPALELAERLSALAPVPDARVFLTSGGGDSIDTAAKLAQLYWFTQGQPERTRIVSRVHAYHGTHGFGTSIGGIEANRAGYGSLPTDGLRVAHDSLEAMTEAIEALGPETVAAIFAEPVIGAGGVRPPAPGYLEGLAALCRETGILLVIDEVISGFGRLGPWFGSERWGIEPDMITFAKGVTSGVLPLGGVIASGRVAAPFWEGDGAPPFRHGQTYAGHPTCCAAALANLDVLERDGLIGRARELEGDLLATLTPLADRSSVVEVRGGTGLMAAVELTPELLAEVGGPGAVARALAERGVIVRPLGTGIAVSPPLTVQADHLRLIEEATADALSELERGIVPEPASPLSEG
jgi:putrescine aminotransferase